MRNTLPRGLAVICALWLGAAACGGGGASSSSSTSSSSTGQGGAMTTASGTGGSGTTSSAGGAGGTGGAACDPAKCPPPSNECVEAACDDQGACTENPLADGTLAATQSAGDCKKAVCQGGLVTSQSDDGDLADDGNDCTDDTCASGNPQHPPRPIDTACGQDAKSYCDGAGTCVGCTAAGQCQGPKDECQQPSCEGGACGTSFTSAGTPTMSQTMGDCKQSQCDGNGNIVPAADPSDPEDDGNPCTVDTCSGDMPAHAPAPINQACGNGLKCDGAGNCVTCTADNDCPVPGNACLVAVCSGGMCGTADKMDGTACNDGNACTQSDTCQSGACTGNSPVICSAMDQCHDAGACDPMTGACSNPSKANNAPCSDNNGCTTFDSCQNGACVGANPIVCFSQDACHVAGVCNPATGVCSTPNATNGTPCNDGNACTTSDACQNGACTGASPVVCSAMDQCHDAGVCNPATGMCSNPSKANGAACNDGNGCTQTDTCQNGACMGANPVVCSAMDQCHTAGVCDAGTGVCSNPNKANGTACNDGNACTQTDTCQNGACTGANPVVCSALDSCHTAGVCNSGTGVCSNPNKANGTACNDGNACTQADTCQNGACTGANPVVCPAPDQCHTAGVCNSGTGVCSNPSKPDGSACTLGGQAGTCGNGACSICGNGVVEGNEQCDDSNATPCDGCSPKCQFDTSITYASAGGLALVIPDDGYNGMQSSMACVNVNVVASGDSVVDYVCPTVAMAHTWIGDLTIKLVSPMGTVITLMSMPGVVEAADNGTSVTGDSSNLLATFPITWKDGAAVSAENMGNTLLSSGVVCRDDSICVFNPNAGAASPGKLAAFVGQAGPGTWKLCIGDSGVGDVGSIDQVKLVIGQ